MDNWGHREMHSYNASGSPAERKRCATRREIETEMKQRRARKEREETKSKSRRDHSKGTKEVMVRPIVCQNAVHRCKLRKKGREKEQCLRWREAAARKAHRGRVVEGRRAQG